MFRDRFGLDAQDRAHCEIGYQMRLHDAGEASRKHSYRLFGQSPRDTPVSGTNKPSPHPRRTFHTGMSGFAAQGDTTAAKARQENTFALVTSTSLSRMSGMSFIRNRILTASKLGGLASILGIGSVLMTGCVGPTGARFAPVVLPSATLVPNASPDGVKKTAPEPKNNSLQIQASGGVKNYNPVDGTAKKTWYPAAEASLTYLRHLENSNIDLGVVAYSNFVLSHGAGFALRWKHRRGKRWVIAPGFSLGFAWGGMNLATAVQLAPKHWAFGEIGAQVSGLGPEMTASIGMVHRFTPRFSLQYGINQRMAFSVHASDYVRNNPSGHALSMMPTFSMSPVIHF